MGLNYLEIWLFKARKQQFLLDNLSRVIYLPVRVLLSAKRAHYCVRLLSHNQDTTRSKTRADGKALSYR